ncbi:MAG: HAD family hydrolase [Spirochaetales bacterium]|nr:HAD family hydrolase [Spirochaetales bacterium]
MIKSWIFDMDGVLINSEPLHYEVDQLILEEQGCPVEPSYLDRFVGMTNEAMWKTIKADLGLSASVEELTDRQVSLKIDLIRQRDYRAIEGVPELMESLKKQGISMGVASSSPRVLIRVILEKLDLEKYVSAWESAEEVAQSKPAPDVYLHVANLLGSKPEECTAVEDSGSGVRAAKAAGMTCIGFKNPHSGDQDLSPADRIVNSIKEIKC